MTKLNPIMAEYERLCSGGSDFSMQPKASTEGKRREVIFTDGDGRAHVFVVEGTAEQFRDWYVAVSKRINGGKKLTTDVARIWKD